MGTASQLSLLFVPGGHCAQHITTTQARNLFNPCQIGIVVPVYQMPLPPRDLGYHVSRLLTSCVLPLRRVIAFTME